MVLVSLNVLYPSRGRWCLVVLDRPVTKEIREEKEVELVWTKYGCGIFVRERVDCVQASRLSRTTWPILKEVHSEWNATRRTCGNSLRIILHFAIVKCNFSFFLFFALWEFLLHHCAVRSAISIRRTARWNDYYISCVLSMRKVTRLLLCWLKWCELKQSTRSKFNDWNCSARFWSSQEMYKFETQINSNYSKFPFWPFDQ